jgi:hypothetical protein
MPFGSGSHFGFTEKGISAFAPRTSGVFAIFNPEGCVFVGDSEDLEAGLYAHLRGDSNESCWIRSQNPTWFSFENCDEKTRAEREHQLIVELDPVCNRV